MLHTCMCCIHAYVAYMHMLHTCIIKMWFDNTRDQQCRLDMRKYSFTQRVINEWNKLSNDCVNASSVNMFKYRIDRYLIRAGYT